MLNQAGVENQPTGGHGGTDELQATGDLQRWKRAHCGLTGQLQSDTKQLPGLLCGILLLICGISMLAVWHNRMTLPLDNSVCGNVANLRQAFVTAVPVNTS